MLKDSNATFIELTHHNTKKKISINISKIEAILKVEPSSYDRAVRITPTNGSYF